MIRMFKKVLPGNKPLTYSLIQGGATLLLGYGLNAQSEELRDELNQKNVELIEHLDRLNAEIKSLRKREKNSIDSRERLDKMLKILERKELTPDMITKDILDLFIYRIIAISDKESVFVIDGTKTMPVEKLVEHRQSITKLDPLYTSKITGYDSIKKVTMTYKVVLI